MWFNKLFNIYKEALSTLTGKIVGAVIVYFCAVLGVAMSLTPPHHIFWFVIGMIAVAVWLWLMYVIIGQQRKQDVF